ncbi:hypothetical protein L2D14_04250 [Thalassospiraceae bacterium LMO-JJ14]|nr:hypothetical protein L2D14_04250 [Thalassospiraceae bacterium LMO-JJ14]
MRLYLSVIAALFLIACGLTVYGTLQDIRASVERDNEILAAEVRDAAQEIERHLADRQKLVQQFADENPARLNALADTPNDAELRHRIAASLRQRFPGYFTFTIADRDGNDLIDDLEGFVGTACVDSIREYVGHLTSPTGAGADYRTVIHPQANNYHFDVMAPWMDGDDVKGVFFVSFFPTALRSILQANQGAGHQLAIINTARPYLLEVNSLGARDKISARRDINLTQDEQARIKAAVDIPGSYWRVVGYPRANLHEQYRADAWFRTSMILSLIGFIAGAAAMLVGKRRRT